MNKFALALVSYVNCKPCPLRHCGKKLKSYSTSRSSDLDDSFTEEVVQFACLLKSVGPKTPYSELNELEMWKMFEELQISEALPNMQTILLIYLCMMISNCSGERSFSVLKRIKHNLRSTMRKPRFNALSILCIESKLLPNIDTNDTINKFAVRKCR